MTDESAPPYHAEIEWLCGHAAVLRLYDRRQARHGDPYVWCCTVLRRGDAAVLKGAVTAPPPGGARAILWALRRDGMSRREYERISRRGTRTVSATNLGRAVLPPARRADDDPGIEWAL